ncbi:hypothetical protein PMIN03_002366 [Paraphaeosphaeria minitans]
MSRNMHHPGRSFTLDDQVRKSVAWQALVSPTPFRLPPSTGFELDFDKLGSQRVQNIKEPQLAR